MFTGYYRIDHGWRIILLYLGEPEQLQTKAITFDSMVEAGEIRVVRM
jgi:hypothetical protein